jgi:hypothetical protein
MGSGTEIMVLKPIQLVPETSVPLESLREFSLGLITEGHLGWDCVPIGHTVRCHMVGAWEED